ncbi:thioredoxin domain-containing protein [Sphingomicrobium lutaoense]|nr:thioredoxin domain-containing protein [Sphingomicrobium lutaoense]
MIAAGATLALASCGSGGDDLPVADEPIEAVEAPDGGDWSEMVTTTDAGGYVLGNPDAPVKLVEYGSYTCPACANFDQNGVEPLVENYVKSGRVSYEYRNYVRDPLDITAAILARCGTKESFFPMTHALFAQQRNWAAQGQQALAERGQQIQALPAAERSKAIAEASGLLAFATQRGLPSAKAEACLADEANAAKLVEIANVANQDYEIPGTPTFLLNGTRVDNASQWPALEPIVKAAVGEK